MQMLMHQKTQQIISDSPVYSNDVIDLHFNCKSKKQRKPSVHWETTSQSVQNQLYQKIINKAIQGPKYSQADLVNSQNVSTYYCSSLDFGRKIIGKVTMRSINNNKINAKKFIYGPVILSNQLESYENPQNRHNIQVFLSQIDIRKGQLNISKGQQKNSIIIKLTLQNQDLVMKFSQKNQNIVKFYPFQSDNQKMFGLLISQQQQFKKFMRKLKVSAHLGNYIKIICADKQCRELLFLQMLQMCGKVIPQKIVQKLNQNQEEDLGFIQVKARIRKLQILQLHNIKQQSNQNYKNHQQCALLNTFGSNTRIPILQKNQIQIQQQEEIIPQENNLNAGSVNVIQEIYNILNTPLSSIQKQMELNHFELDAHNKRFYKENSTKNVNMLYSQTIQPSKLLSNSQKSQENSQIKNMNFRKTKKSAIDPKTMQKSQIMYVYKEKQSAIKQLLETSESDNLEVKQVQMNYDQIERIKQENEQLKQQNKRLKQDNLNLRFQKLKNDEIDMTKMFEIRQMVQKMAKRLQVLQTVNQSYAHSKSRQINRYFKFNQPVINRHSMNSQFKVSQVQTKFSPKHFKIINQAEKQPISSNQRKKLQTVNRLQKNENFKNNQIRSNKAKFQKTRQDYREQIKKNENQMKTIKKDKISHQIGSQKIHPITMSPQNRKIMNFDHKTNSTIINKQVKMNKFLLQKFKPAIPNNSSNQTVLIGNSSINTIKSQKSSPNMFMRSQTPIRYI